LSNLHEMMKSRKEMTHSKSKIVHKTLPQDDPIQRKPDLTKAKEKLDWESTIPLL